MNRHPPSNYGDEPPAYIDHEASSYLSDVESPTATARQNGATMRLLPTSGDDGDLSGSPVRPSSSHYQSDYDDSTPYVLVFIFLRPWLYSPTHSSRCTGYTATCTLRQFGSPLTGGYGLFWR